MDNLRLILSSQNSKKIIKPLLTAGLGEESTWSPM
jgi:hypothetical protein